MNNNLRIVTIGGGTGLSVLLRGLKKVTNNITAIVSVADDGGGSGILREDLGMLPPGDIRSCILALANTEPIMEDLIKYRFSEGVLKGQNFGNLLIAALEGVSGSFEMAIERISDIFAITGRVLPVSLEEMTLVAELEDGQTVQGESHIPVKVLETGQKIKSLGLDKPVMALDDAIQAIYDADVILLGPGSLYTSIIPNLLADGLVTALEETMAKRVYIANVMTQPGETDGYSVSDHIKAIADHSFPSVVDHVMVNQTKVPKEVLAYYEAEGSEPVYLSEKDICCLKKNGIGITQGRYLEVFKGYVRHEALAISKDLVELVDAKIYRKNRAVDKVQNC